MHDKVNSLVKDVARLRDELSSYRPVLSDALGRIRESVPANYKVAATRIREAAEILAMDIGSIVGRGVESNMLGILLRQLSNTVPSLTRQSDQVERVHHTWIRRLKHINDIVGGGPHFAALPPQLDSLVECVEELLTILRELYCEYGTSFKYSTIYFDVAPILRDYKQQLGRHGKSAIQDFIPLDTELIDESKELEEEEEEEEEEEYQGEPLPQPMEKARSKESLNPVPILKALSEHTRVTVLGDAGSGKTETAIAFCREFNAAGEYNIAIHIRLKLFGDGGMDALIRGSLGKTLPVERPLEKFGPEWHVALVCDGLDECSETRRTECIRSICELAMLNVIVVVLSREHGLQLDQLPAWTTYKLKAFDDGQRDAFLKSRLPEWVDTERTALVRQINSQQGGKYLFHNPYFLYVLTELLRPPKPPAATHLPADGAFVDPDHHGDGSLSSYDYEAPHALSRVRIMRELIERTLRRELTKLGKERVDEYLPPLVGAFSGAGFHSLFSEEGSFTADDFAFCYVKERGTRRLTRSELENLFVRTEFLEFLPDASLYSFPHRNIETFLAAWYVYKHPGHGKHITQDVARDCTHVLSFLLEMGARPASPPPKGRSEQRGSLDASLYRIAWELDPLLAVTGHTREDDFLAIVYGPLVDARSDLLVDPWRNVSTTLRHQLRGV